MKRGKPSLNVEKPYPTWVCLPCGNKYGRGYPAGHVCTIHQGVCGICGEKRAVTQLRDFGWLMVGWRDE